MSGGRTDGHHGRTDDALELLLLRATQAPARLLALDVARAASLPGVHCVLRSEDLDVGTLLAPEVRFPGQVIAALAAETRDAGERALEALVPRFEDPQATPVADGGHAASTREPIAIHDSADSAHAELWSRAHLTHDLSYSWSARALWGPVPPEILVTHQPLGRLLVRTSTYAPFALRRALADSLDLPVHTLRVQVAQLTPGGPTGLAPTHAQLAALCALAARRSGRAVLLTLSRADELAGFALRAERRIELQTLVEDGVPRALHLRLDVELGACDAQAAAATAGRAWRHAERLTRERLPGLPLRVSGRAWCSARPPAVFDEAAASEAVTFALASWDRDLWRTHFQHRAPPTSRWPPRYIEGNALETLALQRLNPRPSPERGEHQRHLRRGLAPAFVCWPGLPADPVRAVALELLEDGALRLRLGRPDGDGALLALLRAQVATEFALPSERVHVSAGDTDVAPAERDDAAPSEAHVVDALLAAARALRTRLLAQAALALDLPVGSLTLYAGGVQGAGRRLSFSDLAARALAGQGLGPLSAEAHASRDSRAGRAAAAASVDVDLETGSVRVLGLALIVDVGAWPEAETLARISSVAWRALSAALSERQVFDAAGRPLLLGLNALRPTRVGDAPTPLVGIIPTSEDRSSVRGAPVADWDEACSGIVAAALAHAIADACRARPRDVPMGPEQVLRTLAPEAPDAWHAEP